MVHCPISAFCPHLSSIIRFRQAAEGQGLGTFAQALRDSGHTVSGHIFGQSHKTGSREAIAAFVSGKGAFTASTDNGDCIVAPAVLLRERLVAVWSCSAYVPVSQLIYAAFRSNAKGLFPPNDECRRLGL